MAGILGGCATGIFATVSGSAAFDITNPGGAIAGNGVQVGYQIAGACFIVGWNVVWTSLIMCFIKYVLRIPLRMSDEQLLIGDYSMHGEEAYVFGEGSGAYVSGPLRGKEVLGAAMGEDTAKIIMGKNPDIDERPNGSGSGSDPISDEIKRD